MAEQTTPIEEMEDTVFVFPEKEAQSDHYELMVLIATKEATEEQANATLEEVKKLIAAQQGTITQEENLGNRALAYTINAVRRGFYYVCEFDMDKSHVALLHESIRIRKDVTRFLLLKKHVKSAEEAALETKVHQKIDERRKAKMEESIAKVEAKPEERKPARTEAAPQKTDIASTETPKPKEDVSPEKLDKEIEKLLSDDLEV